jgi:hypothetical protein
MKTLSPDLVAHLGARGALQSHVLVWFDAVQKLDASPAGWGVWTGDDDRTFTIGGASRTYFGAGAMGAPDTLTFEVGYVVRITRVALAHLQADVANALALTDIRLRPVELHQAHLRPGSHDLVAEPLLRLAGVVEALKSPRLGQGEEGMAEVQIASSARAMTRPLELTKSDATLQALHSGDGFRRWNSVSGKVSVGWGELTEKPPPRPIVPVISRRPGDDR